MIHYSVLVGEAGALWDKFHLFGHRPFIFGMVIFKLYTYIV
jgi:hypothetical protein